MKATTRILTLLLVTVMLLTACSGGSGAVGEETQAPGLGALPFPDAAFTAPEERSVIGSIVQTGDGNAYVSGTVPVPRARTFTLRAAGLNEHLVTLSHSFGESCYVAGYLGHSLYILQGFDTTNGNKNGIGHKDGTVLIPYDENGYDSVSAFHEGALIVGNADPNAAFRDDSFTFGYLHYDPETRTFTPLYAENNLRFYTAGYFLNGIAVVSVKENGKILFGVIDTEGNYVVEPQYEIMADEVCEDLVIVALSSTAAGQSNIVLDACGKRMTYDASLMSEVQGTREYERKSSTVGLINARTGESVLPCQYAYIERVKANTYFLRETDGTSYLFDAVTKSFTAVEKGYYSYFNSEYMLYTLSGTVGYLVDEAGALYELTDTRYANLVTDYYGNAFFTINTNVISAARDEAVKKASEGRLTLVNRGVEAEYDRDAERYTLTVTATGDVIGNVRTYTLPYNGGFLYTVDNSLYRYDVGTRLSTKIETGYGDFTEDYEGWDATYNAEVGEMKPGVYSLRYNIRSSDGSNMYLLILVSDTGVVLFNATVNEVHALQKNYLGYYDDALYELAGNTDIEDNYYITRYDGSHCLVQFVRAEGEENGSSDSTLDTLRIIDTQMTLSLLSPFRLSFADGSTITVTICGYTIPSDCYLYNEEEQSLKFLGRVVDHREEILLSLIDGGALDITVTAGEETVDLRIAFSPYALR